MLPSSMNRLPAVSIAWMMALFVVSCDGPADQSNQNESSPQATREVRVITSGGFAAAYNVLGPEFEKATGIRLVTAYGSSSGGAVDSIPLRLGRGEPADVIILSCLWRIRAQAATGRWYRPLQ